MPPRVGTGKRRVGLERMGIFSRNPKSGLVGIVLALLAPSSVWSADLFTVRGVSVDVTAATAVAARAQAEREGRRRAFTRLLARLAVSDHHGRLPALSDQDVLGLVKGHGVQAEKTSTVRYIGDLDFAFRPAAVRRLFDRFEVDYAVTTSGPVLVVPVRRVGPVLRVWEEDNRWREAWNALPDGDGLVPVMVPFGDLDDMSDIGPETAARGDPRDLIDIASRYGADRAAYAVLASADLPTTGPVEFTLTVTMLDANGKETSLTEGLSATNADAIEDVMVRAVEAVRRWVQDSWKSRNLVRRGVLQHITVAVPISDHTAWLDLTKRLNRVDALQSWQVLQLNRQEARLDLSTRSETTTLRMALARAGLTLAEGAQTWRLSAGTTDPAVQ